MRIITLLIYLYYQDIKLLGCWLAVWGLTTTAKIAKRQGQLCPKVTQWIPRKRKLKLLILYKCKLKAFYCIYLYFFVMLCHGRRDIPNPIIGHNLNLWVCLKF